MSTASHSALPGPLDSSTGAANSGGDQQDQRDVPNATVKLAQSPDFGIIWYGGPSHREAWPSSDTSTSIGTSHIVQWLSDRRVTHPHFYCAPLVEDRGEGHAVNGPAKADNGSVHADNGPGPGPVDHDGAPKVGGTTKE
ncbi:hypothetical protein MD484_g8364, partial [Candolleomyces efflorescens]